MKKKIIILLSVAIIFALAAILLIRINEKPQNEASESIVDAVNKAAGIVATDTEERAEKERAAKEKKEKAARARKAKVKKESDLEKLRQNMSLRENIVEEFIHGDKGKEYQKYCGIAFETGFLPDSPNRPDFPDTILRPGEEFRSNTEYRFFYK